MPISPIAVGALLPSITIQLLQDGPSPVVPGPPVNLTGLGPGNFTMNIYNVNTKTDQVGAGTFFVINGTSGLVLYMWDPADTAMAGSYQLFVSIYFATSGPLIADPIPLTIVVK